jgi:hypothetical protein
MAWGVKTRVWSGDEEKVMSFVWLACARRMTYQSLSTKLDPVR